MGGMDFRELRRYKNNLDRVKKDFKDWLADFLIIEANKAVNLARNRTPVDTGALKASWTVGDQKLKKTTNEQGKIVSEVEREATRESLKVAGNTYYVTISNGMFYASFVEYGTKRMGGKYIITRSLDDIRRELPSRFNKEFEAFLKRLGGA